MNIDDMLRNAANDVAQAASPSIPDAAGVRSRARRTRTIHVAGATLAVATVAAVAAVGIRAASQDDAAPPPVDVPPTTALPSIDPTTASNLVWSQQEVLYLRGSAVQVDDAYVVGMTQSAGGVVYTTDFADGDVFYQPFRGGSASLIGTNAQLAPVADPNSEVVAWIENVDGEGAIVVFDLEHGEVARAPARIAVKPQDNITFPGYSTVLSVSQEEVFYVEQGEVWVYRYAAGRPPESTGEKASSLLDVSNGVVARRVGGRLVFDRGGDSIESVQLGPRSAVTSRGMLSPDGAWFLGGTGAVDEEPILVDTRSGDQRTLGHGTIPRSWGLLFALSWVDDDTVVLRYSGAAGTAIDAPLESTFLVCTVSTGACVQAPVEGEGFLITTPLS
jgi:hypothetical protein